MQALDNFLACVTLFFVMLAVLHFIVDSANKIIWRAKFDMDPPEIGKEFGSLDEIWDYARMLEMEPTLDQEDE